MEALWAGGTWSGRLPGCRFATHFDIHPTVSFWYQPLLASGLAGKEENLPSADATDPAMGKLSSKSSLCLLQRFWMPAGALRQQDQTDDDDCGDHR